MITDMDLFVKELHRNLENRYTHFYHHIEQFWQKLTLSEREDLMRPGIPDPKKDGDEGLEFMFELMPEWNLQDLTSEPDYLLNIIKWRATTSLETQFTSGMDGSRSDHAWAVDIMEKTEFHDPTVEIRPDCFIVFLYGDRYGQSTNLVHDAQMDVSIASSILGVPVHLILPQELGHYVLLRQSYMLQQTISAFDIILWKDLLPHADLKPEQADTSSDAATVALNGFSILTAPKTINLSDAMDGIKDQKASREEAISLLSTEPVYLTDAVLMQHVTQPQLVYDEKGYMTPVSTDRYISLAFFDAVHGTVSAAATWNYISTLLTMLSGGASDKLLCVMTLQELSNTCHSAYKQGQEMLKRTVATGPHGYTWFRRISTPRKDGTIRLNMKYNPEALTVKNPQLHYLLRLCQDETTCSQAAEWLQRLEHLHRAYPSEKDKMREEEFYVLSDLAIVVALVQNLSSVLQLPPVSQKSGQIYLSGCSSLSTELKDIRTSLDLSDFAAPVVNLLRPGIASAALVTCDEYVVAKTGTKLGILYQDLVNESVEKIRQQYERNSNKMARAKEEYVAPTIPGSGESRVQQRKRKAMAHNAEPTVYDIVAPVVPADGADDELINAIETVKVKQSTFSVFLSLLSRSSTRRGSVSWDAFIAAMVDIGFSVIPKFGSVFTFLPSEGKGRSLTLHRPHGPHVEGVCLLMYSRRLKYVYK